MYVYKNIIITIIKNSKLKNKIKIIVNTRIN